VVLILIRPIKISFIFVILLFSLAIGIRGYAVSENDERIIIEPTTKKVNVYEQMTILQDKAENLTIDDVIRNKTSGKFTETVKGIPNFGYIDSVFWTRFSIKNTTDIKKWFLEISYPFLEEITLFTETPDGKFVKEDLGSKYPFTEREIEHRNFIFTLLLEPNEEKQYFVRVKTGSSMQLPIVLWDEAEFIKKTQKEFTLLGLFYGVLTAMALYNLFLYFSLRHKSYLYYVLVILCTMFSNMALNGVGYQYIWPDYPWFNQRSVIVILNLGSISAILFAQSFLDTHKYVPKFKNIARSLIGLNIVNLFTVFFISYKIALNLIIWVLLISVFSIIIVGFICLKRGLRQARFFLVSWVIFIIGIAISATADGAFFPLSIWSKYAVQITAALEGILLSFALADKINILRSEKEIAQLDARESHLQAVENLQQADKVKDEFLAITSHELRTPLYGIIGIAEGLREGVEGSISKSMESQLSMIVNSGKRLSELVDDILDFSKLKHSSVDMKIQEINVFELVNVVLVMCNPLVGDKSLKLNNKIQKSLPTVSADQNQLIQIFYNLIGNAIKYTVQGSITIDAEIIDGKMKISVTDTGKGIPEEAFEEIFVSFHQIDESLAREVGGTGIGLSITKYLIEMLGGEINVKSSVGVGSTFSFTIPLYDKRLVLDEVVMGRPQSNFVSILKENTKMGKVSKPKHNNNRARILIADDEPVNLQVLINYLSLEDYEVVAVSNGEQVLELVEEVQFDLLILDVMMPRLSGYEVTKRLRKKYTLTELPILMLTAKNQLSDKVTSFEVGANDYLAKPCDKEELFARVKTLIDLSLLTRKLTKVNQLLEKKVAERTQELIKTNDDLIIVNEELKMVEQSRTILLSSLSHELGTPITLIQSYIQAVNEGLIKEDNPRYLEMIQRKLDVLNRLTNDLFELAKLRSGFMSIQLKEINFNEWITHLATGLEADLERSGVNFRFEDLTYKEALITIDAQRMSQAFSNLVWNAVRHTPSQNGEILLTSEIVDDVAGKWDKLVRIQIIDNGVGISKDELPFIFDRFYKAKNQNLEYENEKGTGLGLAITKEIITFHNGEISVSSEIEKGTTFTVELPLTLNL